MRSVARLSWVFSAFVAGYECGKDPTHAFGGAIAFQLGACLCVAFQAAFAKPLLIRWREFREMEIALDVALHAHDADAVEVSEKG